VPNLAETSSAAGLGAAPRGSRPKTIAIALVAVSLLPAAWLILGNRDVPQFGTYGDGELLFIGAKSLSEGQGFRILSLPDAPYQTKYQPLQPLLLAAAWKIDPHFPSNLSFIAAYDWLTLVAFVSASGFFFATMFSPIESAALAASIALSPLVIYWATVPTADYLFAALALAAFLAFRRAISAQRRWFIVTGILAAAAYFTKSAGILIIPAILIALLFRRDWRGAVFFLAPSAPVVIGWIFWAQTHRTTAQNPVLWYYTDYLGAFLKNDGLSAIPQILPVNLLSLIGASGAFLIHDLPESVPGRFFCILIAAATVTGAIRISKRTGIIGYPVFCGLLAAVLSVWNFSPSVRLILPIVPLVAAGVYLEIRKFSSLIRQALPSGGSNRITALLLIAGFLIGCAYGIRRDEIFIFQTIPSMMEQAREENRRARPVYEWMRRSLPPSSVVMASADTLVYLNTGLASVFPVPNSIAFYRRDRRGMLENFTQLDQLASFFGITHILISPHDFETVFEPADRAEIRRLIFAGANRREIFAQNGYTVLQIGGGAKIMFP